MSGKGNFTPTLTRLAKKAKLLREWTRTGIFEGDSVAHQALGRKVRYEGRQEMNKRLEQIARDQRNLNNFYDEIGFPSLPKNHVLSKCWDEKLARVRRAMEPPKPRKKRAKKGFGEVKSDKSQQEDDSTATEGSKSVSKGNKDSNSTRQKETTMRS